MPKGRYYLSRIVKMGSLNNEVLIAAIKNAKVIETKNYGWALTDIVEEKLGDILYIFGKLSKFKKNGEISIIDRESKMEVKGNVDDLSTAICPFVYFPSFSGIAYLHVWNQIQEDTFRIRFQEIMKKTNDQIFSKCELEQITDYRTFVARLNSLTQINELAATVHPPNPLFGRHWKSLKEHLIERNAETIKFQESTEKSGGLKTNIKSVFNAISNNTIDEIANPNLSLIDSALLMAADGYGKGKIVGIENRKTIVIKTGENQKNFLFDKAPDHQRIAEETLDVLRSISNERRMEH